MVVLVPEPEVPDNPITVGVDEIVQVPVEGKLLNTTVPLVAAAHVTLEIAPIVGGSNKLITVGTLLNSVVPEMSFILEKEGSSPSTSALFSILPIAASAAVIT